MYPDGYCEKPTPQKVWKTHTHRCDVLQLYTIAGGFKYAFFSPLHGDMIQFD